MRKILTVTAVALLAAITAAAPLTEETEQLPDAEVQIKELLSDINPWDNGIMVPKAELNEQISQTITDDGTNGETIANKDFTNTEDVIKVDVNTDDNKVTVTETLIPVNEVIPLPERAFVLGSETDVGVSATDNNVNYQVTQTETGKETPLLPEHSSETKGNQQEQDSEGPLVELDKYDYPLDDIMPETVIKPEQLPDSTDKMPENSNVYDPNFNYENDYRMHFNDYMSQSVSPYDSVRFRSVMSPDGFYHPAEEYYRQRLYPINDGSFKREPIFMPFINRNPFLFLANKMNNPDSAMGMIPTAEDDTELSIQPIVTADMVPVEHPVLQESQFMMDSMKVLESEDTTMTGMPRPVAQIPVSQQPMVNVPLSITDAVPSISGPLNEMTENTIDENVVSRNAYSNEMTDKNHEADLNVRLDTHKNQIFVNGKPFATGDEGDVIHFIDLFVKDESLVPQEGPGIDSPYQRITPESLEYFKRGAFNTGAHLYTAPYMPPLTAMRRDMPDDMQNSTPNVMPSLMSNDMPDDEMKYMPYSIPYDIPTGMPEAISHSMNSGIFREMPHSMHNYMPYSIPNNMAYGMHNDMSYAMRNDMHSRLTNGIPNYMLNGMPNAMPYYNPYVAPYDIPHGTPYFVPYNTPYAAPYTAAYNTPYASPYTAAYNTPYASPYTTSYNTPYASPYTAAYNTPYAAPYTAAYNTPYASPYTAAYNTPYAAPYTAAYNTPYAAPYTAAYNTPYAAPYTAAYNTPYAAPYTAAYDTPYATPYTAASSTPYVTPYDMSYVTPYNVPYATLYNTPYDGSQNQVSQVYDFPSDNPFLVALRRRIIMERINKMRSMNNNLDYDNMPPMVRMEMFNKMRSMNNDLDCDNMPPMMKMEMLNKMPSMNNDLDYDNMPPMMKMEMLNKMRSMNNDLDYDNMPPMMKMEMLNKMPSMNNDLDYDNMPPMMKMEMLNKMRSMNNDLDYYNMPPMMKMEMLNKMRSMNNDLDYDNMPPMMRMQILNKMRSMNNDLDYGEHFQK